MNAGIGIPNEQPDPVPAPDLPGAALVVRYGEMKDYDLTKSAFAEHDDPDSQRWGVSVLCRPNLTALQLLEMKPLKHPQFRVSTVGGIRGLALEVWLDEVDPPHALILYSEEPTTDDWDRLRSVFGESQPNPFGD